MWKMFLFAALAWSFLMLLEVPHLISLGGIRELVAFFLCSLSTDARASYAAEERAHVDRGPIGNKAKGSDRVLSEVEREMSVATICFASANGCNTCTVVRLFQSRKVREKWKRICHFWWRFPPPNGV